MLLGFRHKYDAFAQITARAPQATSSARRCGAYRMRRRWRQPGQPPQSSLHASNKMFIVTFFTLKCGRACQPACSQVLASRQRLGHSVGGGVGGAPCGGAWGGGNITDVRRARWAR